MNINYTEGYCDQLRDLIQIRGIPAPQTVMFMERDVL